ncbi:SDR family oxidoreductase [Opitutales bacterium ASA1]|nr:SDR family oxidoreductase [Opitutales bacterium ASA1]
MTLSGGVRVDSRTGGRQRVGVAPTTAPLFDLTGRRALITGSSQGIGLCIARGLAQAGASVVLNGRDAGKLERAAQELRASGAAVEARAFDVTDEAAIAAARDALDPIDILVNNAGMHRRGPLVDMPLENWDAVLRSNLTAPFLMARAFAPGMIARGRGKVINLCSVMSEIARPTIANYAAAKGGLKMLTRALAVEWGRHNIQVNGLGPGYIATELNRSLIADEKFNAMICGRTPLGRWGRPEEIVGPAVYLASAASDFMTGQILYIDGGILAGL